MTRRVWPLLLLVLAFSSARLATGQVEAGTAAPAPSAETEIKSPMQLAVVIPSFQFTAAMVRKSKTQKWTSHETARFVTDKARVQSVSLARTLKGKDVQLEVSAEVSTNWFRQDINLIIELLGPDGHSVASQSWKNLTIGNQAGSALVFGSSTKFPTVEHRMKESEFYSLFSGQSPSKVRVTLEVVQE